MKLNFMLSDDNKIDLFISHKIIEKVGAFSNIKKFTSAISAICCFKLLEITMLGQKKFTPDIIFLDINMPKINGFQFISEFEKLNIKEKEKIKIFILSSSTNTEDVQKAIEQQSCVGFINKPLTQPIIEEIVGHFKPYLTQYDCLNHDNEHF